MSKCGGVRDESLARLLRFSQSTLLCAALALAACSGESTQTLMDQAKKELANNNSKAAVIQLKNVLQKDPKQVDARFLLGQLLLESGDAVGAAIEFQKAKELGYAEDKLVPLLAKARLLGGQPDKVISEFGSITLQTPVAQADLQVILANAYRSQGRMPEARNAIKQALTIKPDDVAAQLLHIRTLAADKDLDGAKAALDKLLAASPGSSEAWQLKAEVLQFGGDAEAATAAFKQAIEHDKRNVSAHSALLWMLLGKKDIAGAEQQLKLLSTAEPQHPQVKFFTGVLALEKGDLKLAGEQSQLLLKQTPNNLQALQLAGTVELRTGSLIQAEAHFGQALQIAPANGRVRLLLAQTQLRAGDPAKSVKTLQPLVDAPTPQWEPTALMAQALLMSGEGEKAEYFFAKAAKLNPGDARSRTALALAQVSKGQSEQGFEELRSIAQADPGPTADLAMINALLRKKDVDGALAAISRLEKKLPGQPLPAFLRGQVEQQRGRPAQARAAYEAALATAPDFFPAISGLAALDVSEGKPDLARQRFQKIVDADPRNVKAGMALVRVSAQAGASQEQLASQLDKLAKANVTEPTPRLALVSLQLERKQYKLAQTAAQEALAAIPDHPDLLDMLGQAQNLGGEVNQAISTYTKLAALRPSSPHAFMRLADIHLAAKDKAAAAQDLKRALVAKPDHVPALRGLMSIEMAEGRNAAALAVARTAQAQRGSEAIGYALEADFEASQKNWPAAAKAFRSSLNKQSSSETAIKLHQVLLTGGETDAALKFEQQWVKQYPSDAGFIFHLGDVALAKSGFDQAQQHYANVVRLMPDHALALNNLAWLLNRAKKPDALKYAQRATRLAPKEAAFQDTLAQIYADSGQVPLAIETQKTALALNPEIHLHRLHLAQMYLSAGEKTFAKQELSHLAALGDKFSGQAEVKALLGKL